MFLITKAQYRQLLDNCYKQFDPRFPCGCTDQIPVVRLHTHDGATNWLLTQIDPDKPTNVLCLSDFGDRVRFSSIPLIDLLSFQDGNGQRLINDLLFVGQEMIWVYQDAACDNRINFSGTSLYRVRYRFEAQQDLFGEAFDDY